MIDKEYFHASMSDSLLRFQYREFVVSQVFTKFYLKRVCKIFVVSEITRRDSYRKGVNRNMRLRLRLCDVASEQEKSSGCVCVYSENMSTSFLVS